MEDNIQFITPVLTDKDIIEFIGQHKARQKPRLEKLEGYYRGDNKEIKAKKRKYSHLSNHKPSHNFAKYVADFMTGYILGNPAIVTHKDEAINSTINCLCTDYGEVNSEIELDCSIFGRAYEIIYNDGHDKSAKLSVFNTFCVYDNSIETKKLAGIRYFDVTGGTEVDIYTLGKYRRAKVVGASLETIVEKPLYYPDIPIVEYKNNRYRLGDFEGVLTLIDLYDNAQADTANYMSDLNDAILVIKGNVSIDTAEATASIKEHNTIVLESSVDEFGKVGSVDAGYIYKQYDVVGSEKYKDRIQSDIHKFTYTPNLSDENFAGQTQSGVAMAYKLFGLEQIRATKERYLKKGFKERYNLLNRKAVLEGLSITFTPNLPRSVTEELKNFNAAMDLPMEERLKLIPSIIDNANIKELAKSIEKGQLMEDFGGDSAEV